MTASISSLKKSSLRRKDTMWIYKNPQGLQLLDDELNERRKKRFSRNRTGPSPQQQQEKLQSPPLSPRAIKPEQVIHVAVPITNKRSTVEKEQLIPMAAPFTDKKTNSPAEAKRDNKAVSSISQIKEALENKNVAQSTNTSVRAINKKVQPLVPTRKILQKETSNTQITTTKKDIVQSLQSPDKEPVAKKLVAEQPFDNYINKLKPKQQPVDSPMNSSIKKVLKTPPGKEVESRRQALYCLNTVKKEMLSLKKDIQPLYTPNELKRETSDKKENQPSHNIMLKYRPPRVSSLPTKETKNDSGSFLMEAKQKLFAVQQQQQQQLQKPMRKSLPVTPIKQNKLVSSFISAFETPSSPAGPPLEPPRHLEIPTTPSASTPLTPPANKVVPVASNSSVLPHTESYFSAVIDRRFNASPTSSEESIQVYLPQLSPEISFCNSTLDVPSDDDDNDKTENERPGIKKRVSFSEQLSTVIPTEDEEEEPMRKFTRTLSSELIEASATLAAEKKVNVLPREKYVPVITATTHATAKPVRPNFSSSHSTPQKLSHKLLDMFQKKPKIVDMPVAAPPTLTHLTKSRPRKPTSLKKPTTLTYPAAVAQPDWRTRAVGTKNIYNPS